LIAPYATKAFKCLWLLVKSENVGAQGKTSQNRDEFKLNLYAIDHSPLGFFRANETTEMNLAG